MELSLLFGFIALQWAFYKLELYFRAHPGVPGYVKGKSWLLWLAHPAVHGGLHDFTVLLLGNVKV